MGTKELLQRILIVTMNTFRNPIDLIFLAIIIFLVVYLRKKNKKKKDQEEE